MFVAHFCAASLPCKVSDSILEECCKSIQMLSCCQIRFVQHIQHSLLLVQDNSSHSVVLLDLHDVVIFTVQRDRSSAHLQLGLLLLQSPADLCQCKGLRHICCLQHRFLHSAHGLLLAANRLPHAPDSLCHGLRMRIVLEAGECPGANELDDHAGDQGAVSIHPQDLERPLPRGHRQGDSLHGQHLVEAPASCGAPPRPLQLH
mmetsp:Transcript_6618/g.15151  ORF Transcript_6618/g.15151 Transcript_6618/m.15151 type:complete len:203 (+) Transcript_6618:2028-2636(+)